MSSIHLLTYNNYYNRIVKQENSLVNYATYQLGSTLLNVNFNPNDGVDTELLIGKGDWSYATPDYLIESENNDILSRWFVLECTRTRAGQYKLKLHRDVIVDNFEAIKTAPMFVERAALENDDPMIFNKENVSFNQIKTSETLLKDSTGCPWMIGYISSKDITDAGLSISARRGQTAADITAATKSAYWAKYSGLKRQTQYTDTSDRHYIAGDMDIFLEFDAMLADSPTTIYRYKYRINDGGVVEYSRYSRAKTTSDLPANYCTVNVGKIGDVGSYLRNALNTSTYREPFLAGLEEGKLIANSVNSTASLANIMEDNGKIVYITDENKTYKVVVTKLQDNSLYRLSDINVNPNTATQGDAQAAYDAFVDMAENHTFNNLTPPTSDSTAQCFKVNYGKNVSSDGPAYFWFYSIDLIETQVEDDYLFVIPNQDNRTHLVDAPYDMFCMPYMDGCKFYVNGTELTTQYPYGKDVALSIANAASANWSGIGFLYDVQLLPYCPLGEENLIYDSSNNFIGIEVGNLANGLVKLDNVVVAYAPFLAWSEFTENLSYSIDIDNPKVQNETDMWRICSPSYGAMFEFNAAKNGGVDIFNVDCQYKPHNPYIHVNPNFKLLYGQDYNDARGLICNPDFSLPMISDQFATYAFQNKNYQNMFDRQIQNMETNYRYNQIEALASGITGTGAGAASGGLTGSMIGGGVGAAAGAVAGGLASGGGMIADLFINQGRYEEQKSFASMNFQYQLDNIKALPNTLTRVSSFNNNNKIFPVLEYYTCTDIEKEAFEEKLKYNGMTVGRIGKLEDFIKEDQSFFKGRLIRLDTIAEDFHMLTAIASEIQQGVFI